MQLARTLAGSDVRLPDFLVIGATKCGTESLHRFLSDHPEVFMHPKKELRFFTEEHAWGNGTDWYRSQFSAAGDARAVGESSNSYTRHPVYPGAAERIHRVLPDARLVYLVRHPIKRIESHYRHRLVMGSEWRRPEEAIRGDPSYISASCYGSQLEQYLRHFPRDQILVIRLEHLITDPAATLGRLCRFLGVREMPGAVFPRVNVTAERHVAPGFLRFFSRFPAARDYAKAASKLYRRSRAGRRAGRADAPPFALGPRTRDELAERFREDRETLSRLLGESFDDWDLGDRPSGELQTPPGAAPAPDASRGGTR